MFLSSLIGHSLKEYGYPGCMLLLAAVSFHCCVSGALLRPFVEPPKISTRSTAEDLDTIGSAPSFGEEDDNAANYAALLSMFSVAAFVEPYDANFSARNVASLSTLHQEIFDKVSHSLIVPLPGTQQPDVARSLEEVAGRNCDGLFMPTRSLDYGIIRYRPTSQTKQLPVTEDGDSIGTADVDDLTNEKVDHLAVQQGLSHSTFKSEAASRVEHVSLFHQPTQQDASTSRRFPRRQRSTMTFASLVTRKTTAMKNSMKRALLMCRHPTLAIYCLNLFVLPLCFNFAVLFLPDTAVTNGLSIENAALLVAVFGVVDSFGMLFWGFLYDVRLFRSRRRLLFSIVGNFPFITILKIQASCILFLRR